MQSNRTEIFQTPKVDYIISNLGSNRAWNGSSMPTSHRPLS